MKFKITKKDSSIRLDKFLASKLKISRSQIKKLIQSGQVLVNRKESSVHNFLREDDLVKVNELKYKNTKIQKKTTLTSTQLKPAKTKTKKIKVIKETKNYIIVDKPAGLLVHATDNSTKETLVDQILKKYPETKEVGDDKNLRPGIIHRLDKDVSGLLLVTRTQKMFDHLKKQFKKREVKKIYQALVHGKILKKEGIINFPIGRSKNTGKMAAKSLEDQTAKKEAITEYEILKYFGKTSGEKHGNTLVQCQIKTGRTHQIRAHLQALAHPIVGDKLYKVKGYKEIDLGRIFLHAVGLGFRDLNGEWVEVKSSLPVKLKNFIKNL